MIIRLIITVLFALILFLLIKRGKPEKIVAHYRTVIISLILFILLTFLYNNILYYFNSILPDIINTNTYFVHWTFYFIVFIGFYILREIILKIRYSDSDPLINFYYKNVDQSYYLRNKFYGLSKIFYVFSIILIALLFLVIFITSSERLSTFGFIKWSPIILVFIELKHFFSGEPYMNGKRTKIIAEGTRSEDLWDYDTIFLFYKRFFNKFILEAKVYEKLNFGEEKPVDLVSILQRTSLLITDPLNEYTSQQIIRICSEEKKSGYQILIVDNSLILLESIRKILSEQIKGIKIFYIKEYSNFPLNVDIYLSTFNVLKNVLKSTEISNVRLIILPTSGTKRIEDLAEIYGIFKGSLINTKTKFLFISEKWNNIEESVRNIYCVKSLEEIQNVYDNQYKRYFILWEDNPKDFYYEEIYHGVNYISPGVVLSLAPLLGHNNDIYWFYKGQFEKDSFETINGIRNELLIEDFKGKTFDPNEIQILHDFRVYGSFDKRFLLISDTYNNLPFVLNLLDNHYSIKEEFINILSRKYLLRNYFIKHLNHFIQYPFDEYLSPIITWPNHSARMTVIMLHNNLINNWNSINVLKETYFYDEKLWKSILEIEKINVSLDFLIKVLSLFEDTKKSIQNLKEKFEWDEALDVVNQFYSIDSSIEKISPSSYFEVYLEGQILKLLAEENISVDNIIYKYKMGDSISIYMENPNDVKFYNIEQFDFVNRQIKVRHSNPQKPVFHTPYIQLDVHQVRKLSEEISSSIFGSYRVEFLCIDFKRELKDLLVCEGLNYLDINKCQIAKTSNYFPSDLLIRNFRFSSAIKFSIDISTQIVNPAINDYSRVTYTLVRIIKELLYSLFPSAASQLHVCSTGYGDILKTESDDFEERYIARLVPSFNIDDNSSEKTISIWIIEESSIGLGVVKYLMTRKNYMNLWYIVNDYLDYYLKYEFEEDYLFFGLKGEARKKFPYSFSHAFQYSKVLVKDQNSLTQNRARWTNEFSSEKIKLIDITADKDTNECDFCGDDLKNKESERLEDGRLRCKVCSKTTLKDIEELKSVLNIIKSQISEIFKVSIPFVDEIYFVNAEELAQHSNKNFIPQGPFVSRTIGLAIRKNDFFKIIIENGAPYWRTFLTIAHELTHIWQYFNLGKLDDDSLVYLEGHAEFVAYKLTLLNIIDHKSELEPYKSKYELQARTQTDVYGEGLRVFLDFNPELNPFEFMINKFPKVK